EGAAAVERHAKHDFGMAVEGGSDFTCGHVPQLHGLVPAARRQQFPIAAQRHGHNASRVSLEGDPLLRLLPVTPASAKEAHADQQGSRQVPFHELPPIETRKDGTNYSQAEPSEGQEKPNAKLSRRLRVSPSVVPSFAEHPAQQRPPPQ